MAVKDGPSYYPTERLISATGRRHYRLPVRSQHWQLRSLISAEKLDTVYFPGGDGSNHVQRLDTTTNECETVRLLSFSPRCLVAQNGWVCCGGETGEFTAIKVRHGSPLGDDRTDLDLRLDDFDADTRQSFETFRAALYGSGSRASRLQSTLEKNLVAKSQKLARDRVNCVTLWFPDPENGPMPRGHYNDPVAVLANNDKTVVVVDLESFESSEKVEALDVIEYPDYVNRAMMSPDGRLLIAILDDPYLYIHRRVEKRVDDQASVPTRDTVSYQWEECNKVLLKSQRCGDSSDSRGSFAACFSKTGAYLAVGTQYGTISIFETQHLANSAVDPLLTSFTSSRPMVGSGAVRDMAFCPGPFDLLAWTEDRGRIGVADIRSGFSQQQILDISTGDGFERVSVLDRNAIDPRLLEGRGERSDQLSSNTASASASSRDARRRRTPGEGLALSHDETLVLEALQIERRRREQTDRIAARLADHGIPAASSPPPGFIGLNRPPTRPTTTAEGESGLLSSRERSSSVARALRELQRDRDERSNITRALTDWLRESRDRNQRMALRSGDRPERTREREPAGAPPLPRRTTTIRPTDATSHAPRSRSTGRGGLAGGWADLEALYNITLEPGTTEAARTETAQREERERDGERERERERDRDRSGILPYINSVAIREIQNRLNQRRQGIEHSVHESPPEPDNTAGISWSEDGRTLFVGAENGIYEFQVNSQGRKYCPSITMR
ncbi:hypothetical protein F5X68DRAFT_234276 [Plectosphaerella plurivora]|uniref:DUF2415 domain-containing protein n=1 Tax=Plectosphaerella plurivora TaxID=936078 RepID=A0A9P9A8L2_9PEZI|nr:hypothetical protein F5X68DRAFT_234276 [Plectosphaerella plurivora]